jgi:histidyl-tRNA synthetase
VGASLGVDRLLAAMEELGLTDGAAAPCPVFLPMLDEGKEQEYLALAGELRRAGVGVELYPEARKLGAQLKYADRRGFRFAVIAGGREFDAGTVQVKDLASKESREVPREDVAAAVSGARG